jgi:predicted nucleic acid-binding protein
LDTSIWLDYYEKRDKNGVIAIQFIEKLIKNNHIIGVSDLNISELKRLGYNRFQIRELLSAARRANSKNIHTTISELDEAKAVSKAREVPRKDVLHAILFRDDEFQLIATDAHFEKLKDITAAKKPEDII